MVRRDFLLSLMATALARPCLAADPALAGVKRIAVVPLVGNVMRIVHDGQAAGTHGENPRREELVPFNGPVLDYLAGWAAGAALRKALPGVDPLLLQMPQPFAEMDPGSLVRGVELLKSRLEKEGIAHALFITRHRGPAQFQLGEKTVGNGAVEGIGFYVDHGLETPGSGYTARYAYLKLAIREAVNGQPLHEGMVKAHRARAVGDPDGFGPLEAMTLLDQVLALRPVIEQGVGDTMPAVVGGA